VPQAASNRAAWVVIFGLALILIIAAIAVPPKTPPPPTPPPPPADARAIVLPDDGVARTVVVPACGSTSPSDPGYVRFQLSGARGVLIPDCAPPANPAPGAPTESSAFVLPVGADVLVDQAAGVGVRQRVQVPARAKARTVIVPACARGTTVRPNAKRQDVILSTATVSATAPAC
jgi:hypothetical protein